MIVETLKIKTCDGYVLDGMLYKANLNPEGNKKLENKNQKEIVVFVHGCTSSTLNTRNEIFATEIMKENKDFFTFNNRGNGIISKVARESADKKDIVGSTFENILEANLDIEAVVKSMINQGYEKIYLLGHSLGCTKILYYLHELGEKERDEIDQYIEKVGLLSLVDFKELMESYDKLDDYRKYAEDKIIKGEGNDLMPNDAFLCPISCKAFYNYVQDFDRYNFVSYKEENYKNDFLNTLNKDLFIRYAEVKEFLPPKMTSQEVVDIMKKQLKQKNITLDVSYVKGASHNYKGKEIETIREYINFLDRK